jgi:excisionase family DNA binding protein
MQNVHFSPPQLARLLKVNESTVKRWIDRGLLKAVRTAGGHRRIRESDLKAFVAHQHKVRGNSYTLSRFAKHTTNESVWEKYFELHRTRRPEEAREVLVGGYIALGSVQQVLSQYVIPSLVHIGASWRAGELDIADEHRMTFRMRADLLALENLIPSPSPRAPHIVFACVPKENHELALILFSLVAREQGWRVTVLGINVPARELERECASETVDAIALAKVYRAGGSIPYIKVLREQAHTRTVPLLVGGGGWSSAEYSAMTKMDNIQTVHSLPLFCDALATLARKKSSQKRTRTRSRNA